MPKLRVPSLQHMARNWRDDPKTIQKLLVNLAKNPPIFNYNYLFLAVRDLLVLNVDYEQVVAGIKRIKRESVRNNFLEVLPLINQHFHDVSPSFVQAVSIRKYPIGRGLMIPFEPPLVYGVGGQLWFPWFSFWRSNPLAAKKLSLFMTVIDEILLQDPDLEGARFHVLDFSAPKPGMARELSVTDSREIPRISGIEKTEMLEIFAEGFFLAESELARNTTEASTEDRPDDGPNDQPDLFR